MGDPPTLKSPYRTGLRTPLASSLSCLDHLQVVDQDDGENSGKEHPERKRKLKKGLAGIKVCHREPSFGCSTAEWSLSKLEVGSSNPTFSKCFTLFLSLNTIGTMKEINCYSFTFGGGGFIAQRLQWLHSTSLPLFESRSVFVRKWH